MNLLTGSFEERLRKSISFAWQVFREKTGNANTTLLPINKEASMQLHYSYILQQVLRPLICFHKDESVKIELETGVAINGRNREIDLILVGEKSNSCHKIAVEMKCYRKLASSGRPRGATDIFMKDVYGDLNLLEEYCEYEGFDRGVCLVMNDLERLVNPTTKSAKCWDYDISHGTEVGDKHFTTPIGGKEINIRLKKSYEFKWVQIGQFWYLEIEGH